MPFLSRWIRSRGFGVHSPFAFRFITECVGERLPYYDYALLAERWQRLLYRVAVFFQPCEIEAYGQADAFPAVLACPPKARRRPPSWIGVESTRLALCGAGATEAEVRAATERGHIIFLAAKDEALLGAIRQALDKAGHGLVFYSPKSGAVAIPFLHLPRQDFEINLW